MSTEPQKRWNDERRAHVAEGNRQVVGAASDARALPALFGRREFMHWSSTGLAGIALARLLGGERRGFAASGVTLGEADDPPPHHPPVADRVIHVCLCGGLSQVDSFDYKPALRQFHGKPLGASERPDVFLGRWDYCEKTTGNSSNVGRAACGSRSCFRKSRSWPTS